MCNRKNIGALILAAGKGTRMNVNGPKVLQTILKEPMLAYVVKTLEKVAGDNIWPIVGYQANKVEDAFPEFKARFILQKEQLGTGHALQIAWQTVLTHQLDWVLVVNGDTPLIPEEKLDELIRACSSHDADIGILTITLDDPGSYGRVIRDRQGFVQAIIEARDFDASKFDQEVNEVNAGIYFLKAESVHDLLAKLDSNNRQNEYYITQLISLASEQNMKVLALNCGKGTELLGVNTPAELVGQEEVLRKKIVNKWLNKGVIIRSPDLVRIGPNVQLEPGVEITGPAEIYGVSAISRGAVIESHSYIENSKICAAHVFSFSHIVETEVEDGVNIGPFARLRPGTRLEKGARIGNFVEVKKSFIGTGSKVNHLSYIGDSEIGEKANVGAGTITCNYDGQYKHKTIIGDSAFIGSNTALVAPVKVGAGALIGAGSTITRDVPENNLGIARTRQKNLKRR
jgi:bifunctional UDP-N-acetylglucosamine pyrophosphorylase/glucosamine-1-phosphate N-acetyltransferase